LSAAQFITPTGTPPLLKSRLAADTPGRTITPNQGTAEAEREKAIT